MLFGFWSGLRYVIQYCPLYKKVWQSSKTHSYVWQSIRAKYKEEKLALLSSSKIEMYEDQAYSPQIMRRKDLHRLRDYYSKLFIDSLPELSASTREQAQCVREEIIHFLNPHHYALSKKEKAILYQPIKHRIRHFYQDFKRWRGYLNLIKADQKHFILGDNIACTKGKVVAQNHLLQLLHYAPEQAVVHRKPILVTSSFINKYYMFDLAPKQSAIAWLVEHGYQVYAISWINADSHLRDCDVHTYLEQGVAWSIEQIYHQHQVPVHLFGYCLGGMLNALARAWLISQGKNYIASETYLASRFDYTLANRLNQLLCDRQGLEILSYLCKRMEKKGYWDGRQISTLFNFVNSKEYFWPLWRTRYIQAKPALPAPLAYWLQDVVHVPKSLARFYLLDLLRDNTFLTKGELVHRGTTLSFSDSSVPKFFIAMKEDQLSLWSQVFTSSQLFLPNAEFLLAKGDHVSGVVSPLQRKHYGYWERKEILSGSDSPETWLESAEYISGSFWQRWEQWLQQYNDEKVAPLYSNWSELEPAPGSYVKKSVWDK